MIQNSFLFFLSTVNPKSPYQVLLRNGNLIDSANPTSAKLDSLVFYQTFANPANTWSGDGTGICPQTIDYIMAGNKNCSRLPSNLMCST